MTNLIRRSFAAFFVAFMLLGTAVGVAPDASASSTSECVVTTVEYGDMGARHTLYCRTNTIDWDNNTSTVGPWEWKGSWLEIYE